MRKISLTSWIMIAMVLGVVVGLWVHYTGSAQTIDSFSGGISVLTDIFLRLIKMIIAPLVFSTLVVGIAKLGDVKSVGRIGGKTLLWFMGASLMSLLLGMVIMNSLELGNELALPLPAANAATGIEQTSLSFKTFITHVFPRSIFEAMAGNEILQIVVFAVFFGIATASIGEQGKIVIKGLDAVAHVILRVTGYVMYFAPVAAMAAIASVLAVKGPELLVTYGKFIISFYLSILGLWLILLLIASIFVGKRVIYLAIAVKDMILLAFSTASSEAAFPRLIQELEAFGCPPKIVSFVLPLGYSFNLDGSMLYMTFASLFIAQAYGIPLTIGQEISMLLVLMLTSKGIAGVPRASLVVIAGTLSLYNIPQQGLLLLLGIDQILDMARSATNVLGNSIAAVVVSKWEGELGETAVNTYK
ncbi:dicarboxylate/amino acid:cation symporter [Flavitalea sp. BT771]|uniref:dicarboxylate/amino acid:cation symporter n=1 Tax=Flavitalea sp. BT771 TaxID=3063329 RepID=UPI0026E402BE|nr:dicarboxylate/amino acid:cation symporter [Flavitalea sp. BT771]MDO6429795.1 dicarboxylate/amino acid:cation symporter [Flavitalea sp. BT771]MDV6218077.1 dicarboxylate/amino acid:cation symporter [Flavitalea sp. BT771]